MIVIEWSIKQLSDDVERNAPPLVPSCLISLDSYLKMMALDRWWISSGKIISYGRYGNEKIIKLKRDGSYNAQREVRGYAAAFLKLRQRLAGVRRRTSSSIYWREVRCQPYNF